VVCGERKRGACADPNCELQKIARDLPPSSLTEGNSEVSEGDDIQEVLRVRIVADALTGGDLDALIELSDALEATGTPEKIRTFVLQLLFELLPDTARDKMAAAGEIEGHSNVIDFFTPKQHGKHTQIGCGAHHGFRCVRGCGGHCR
jgi:hypothetical protein